MFVSVGLRPHVQPTPGQHLSAAPPRKGFISRFHRTSNGDHVSSDHPYDAWSLRAGLILSELPPRGRVTRAWLQQQALHTQTHIEQHLMRFPNAPQAHLNALRDHYAHLTAQLHEPMLPPIQAPKAVKRSLLERVRQGRVEKRQGVKRSRLMPASVTANPRTARTFLQSIGRQVAPPREAALAGNIDEVGIYREVQGSGTNLCGMHALNTVLHANGHRPLTEDHFTQAVLGGMVSHYLDGRTSLETLNASLGDLGAAYHPEHGLRVHAERTDVQSAAPSDLVNIARGYGLHPQQFSVIARGEGVHTMAQFAHADLHQARSVLILRAGHWVGLTKGSDQRWHEINSVRHPGRENLSYAGTAHDAYQALVRDRDMKPESILAF